MSGLPTNIAIIDGPIVAPAMALDRPRRLFHFCSHGVETLGLARSLGWKVHMRCANGYRQETRSMRRCVYRKQLDLETLVCTCGPNFALSRLKTRLMDPGPHQCDDFCPSHVANDELFDLQSQIVIKRYRCAATRLPETTTTHTAAAPAIM